MALIDGNGKGGAAGYAVGVYRTFISVTLIIIGWLATQIWDEIKDMKGHVDMYAVTLENHGLRLDRDEIDLRDSRGDIRALDGRVTRIEIEPLKR